MATDDLNQHLSQITTLWTLVCNAHRQTTEARDPAREAILQRYGEAIKRYLYKALADDDGVQEVYQEWALRFVSGKFGGADPDKGRFRDYLKTVVYHLIVDYRREQAKRRQQLAAVDLEPAVDAPDQDKSAREFFDSWRTSLLERTWELLAEVETSTGQPVHTVLRLRVEQPQLKSPKMAAELSTRLGKPLSADSARQMLRRAREKFADLLIDEVAQTLSEPTLEHLEEELKNLDLLSYCRPRLKKRDS